MHSFGTSDFPSKLTELTPGAIRWDRNGGWYRTYCKYL